MTGIYKITNVINEKIYIGQAIDIEIRWKRHINDLKSNRHCNHHLQRAWNTYGESVFSFSVVKECSEDDLDLLEEFYIRELKAFDPEYGYNLTYGGEGGRRTEEVKQKLRRPKSKPRTAEHCRKLGLAHIGKTPWNKGKKTSDEVRHKQSMAKLGKPALNRKAVLCIDTGIVYASSTEAARDCHVIATNVRKCCRGERPHTCGYHFQYVDTEVNA